MIRAIPEGKRLILGIPPLFGAAMAFPSAVAWEALSPPSGLTSESFVFGLLATLVAFPLSFLGMWTLGAVTYVQLTRSKRASPIAFAAVGALAGALIGQLLFLSLPGVWTIGATVGATTGLVTWLVDRQLDRDPAEAGAT